MLGGLLAYQSIWYVVSIVLMLLLQSTIDEKPIKIDKWDNAALKNALDDSAKNVSIFLQLLKNGSHLEVLLISVARPL